MYYMNFEIYSETLRQLTRDPWIIKSPFSALKFYLTDMVLYPSHQKTESAHTHTHTHTQYHIYPDLRQEILCNSSSERIRRS